MDKFAMLALLKPSPGKNRSGRVFEVGAAAGAARSRHYYLVCREAGPRPSSASSIHSKTKTAETRT